MVPLEEQYVAATPQEFVLGQRALVLLIHVLTMKIALLHNFVELASATHSA